MPQWSAGLLSNPITASDPGFKLLEQAVNASAQQTDSILNAVQFGAADDLSRDLAPYIPQMFAALPQWGGIIRVPRGRFRLLSRIQFPARNVFMDNARVWLMGDPGAILYSYEPSAGQSILDINQFVGQDGQLLISGFILDGTNANAVSGINIHSDNVTLRDLTVRKCKGDGIKFTNDLAAPPIRCTIENVISVLNGRGIVSDSAGVSGLNLHHVTIEGSDGVGLLLKDSGHTVLDGASVIEQNGFVDPTQENMVILGASDVVDNGTYFEDTPNQVHASIRIDATASEMPVYSKKGGRIVGYAVAGAVGINVGPGGGAVRNVSVESVHMVGHKVGIQLGVNVQGYWIGRNNWSSNYDPSSGTSTRVVNNSTAQGFINNLDYFNFGTEGFDIFGRLNVTKDAVIGQTVTAGKTSGDQATGLGSFYDVGTFKGRVASSAAVRFNVLSTNGNSAILNAMGGSAVDDLGIYLQGFGTAADSILGLAQSKKIVVAIAGANVAAFDPADNSVNALAKYKVNGTQVVTTRQAAIPDTTGAALAAVEIELNKVKAMLRVHGLMT